MRRFIVVNRDGQKGSLHAYVVSCMCLDCKLVGRQETASLCARWIFSVEVGSEWSPAWLSFGASVVSDFYWRFWGWNEEYGLLVCRWHLKFWLKYSDAERKKLQDDLDKLTEWANKWQMSFNTNKCKVMHVGRTNQKFTYVMNGQIFDRPIQLTVRKIWVLSHLGWPSRAMHLGGLGLIRASP